MEQLKSAYCFLLLLALLSQQSKVLMPWGWLLGSGIVGQDKAPGPAISRGGGITARFPTPLPLPVKICSDADGLVTRHQ